MNPLKATEFPGPVVETPSGVSRRTFFTRAAAIGATAAIAGSGLAKSASALAAESEQAEQNAKSNGLTSGDVSILVAAEIAEALAVTTYTHIIETAPFFNTTISTERLPSTCTILVCGGLPSRTWATSWM